MSQGVPGHRGGHGAGRDGGLRLPGDATATLGAKLLGFYAFVPVSPVVLVPIVTERAGTAALGDIPAPQGEAKDLRGPDPNSWAVSRSPGTAFLRCRACISLCLCSPGKGRNC